MVTLLKPLKRQLETLELDFDGHPLAPPIPGFGDRLFRPIGSLADFTVLKRLIVDQESIGRLPGFHSMSNSDMTPSEMDTHFEYLVNNAGDFFATFLPLRSLEYLEIKYFDDQSFHFAFLEFARLASHGECPELKHVRLVGSSVCSMEKMDRGWLGLHLLDYLERLVPEEYRNEAKHKWLDRQGYHDLKSIVSDQYWEKAVVKRAFAQDEVACEAVRLFRGAGILFEGLQLKWPVQKDFDARSNKGWMVVYPQPCYGGCGVPDCLMAEPTAR